MTSTPPSSARKRRSPAPGPVAVLGAFRQEVEAVAAALEETGPEEEAGFCRLVRGRIQGRPVLVGTLGVGKVRAAAGTQAVVDRFHPAAMLLCGTAGALAPGIRPLDLVVADRLLQHDARGPGPPEWVEADPALRARLVEAARAAVSGDGRRVHAGGLITGDRPVLRGRERNALHRRFRALAVDMEAAAAGAAAASNGVPFGVLKAVTDSADRKGLLDFKRNVKPAVTLLARAVNTFLADPWDG